MCIRDSDLSVTRPGPGGSEGCERRLGSGSLLTPDLDIFHDRSPLGVLTVPGHVGRGDKGGIRSRAHSLEDAHESARVPYVAPQLGSRVTTRHKEVCQQVRAVALEAPLTVRRAHLDPV